MSARIRSWADVQGRLARLLFRGFQQGLPPAPGPLHAPRWMNRACSDVKVGDELHAVRPPMSCSGKSNLLCPPPTREASRFEKTVTSDILFEGQSHQWNWKK